MALRPCKECGKQISSDATACPHCGKKVKSGMGAGGGCLTVILVLIILGAIGSLMKHSSGGEGDGGNSTVDPKTVALSQVKLDYDWYKTADDTVMEANFTVKNESNYNIKDFEIRCTHFAKSGTEIDHNTRTIYDVVKAHSVKKFPNFNMGFIHSQAVRSSCGITDVSIAP
jgi:hypothetical protein